jgi:hypothetical protein
VEEIIKYSATWLMLIKKKTCASTSAWHHDGHCTNHDRESRPLTLAMLQVEITEIGKEKGVALRYFNEL